MHYKNHATGCKGAAFSLILVPKESGTPREILSPKELNPLKSRSFASCLGKVEMNIGGVFVS